MYLKSKITKIISSLKFELSLFLVFVLYRLPLLGLDFMNTDAPRWKMRTYEFSSAFFSGNFSATNITYHPGVTLMWLMTIGVKISNFLQKIFWGSVDVTSVEGFLFLHFWQKLVLIFFLGFILSTSIYILRKLYGTYFAVIFFVIFTFEPMTLAYTRTLHTDALISFLLFLSVISLIYSYKVEHNVKLWLIISSLSASLAILTKSNSLFILPFAGLIVFLFGSNFKKFFTIKNIVSIKKSYLVWLTILIAGVLLFWPALWVTPGETVRNYMYGITGTGIEEGHGHKWFGEFVEDPGWLFYPITFVMRYTPIFLFLSLIGAGLFKLSFIKTRKVDKTLLASGLFVVLYLLMMTLPTKKLDRYIFPIIPFLALYATYSVEVMLRVFKKYTLSVIVLILSMIFTSHLLSTYKSFPNYISYYSPLVGGYNGARNIDNPKWSFGHRELYTFINSLENASSRQVFMRKPFVYDPFLYGPTYDVTEVKDLSEPGDLYILKGPDDWEYLDIRKHKLLKQINVGDIEYFWVYQFE